MSDKELDLRKLLKGHEGEYFYDLSSGVVRLVRVSQNESDKFPIFLSKNSNIWTVLNNGKGCECDSAYLLFPSRELFEKYPLDAVTAWNVWYESVNPQIKTWEDVDFTDKFEIKTALYHLNCIENNPFIKSAIALIKIQYLIELGYGGVPTKEDWNDKQNVKQCVHYFYDVDRFKFNSYYSLRNSPISFKSRELADEFLSHESNVQLLKDFYMI